MTPTLDAVRREELRKLIEVKPLEWRDLSYKDDLDMISHTALHTYRITRDDDCDWPFILRPFVAGQSNYQSVDEAKVAAQADYDQRIRSTISDTTLAMLAYIAELEAGPKGVWPDFIAPPKYDNPAKGWEDPELPDFRLIWATARKLGWAIGLHGSMKRDCDLIATPWVESAAPPEALLEELCKALNAREVGDREAKPGSRVALNIQIDGWNKLIDLSIVGVPQVPLVTAVPTLTWPDGTTYQFSIEQGRRAIAAALLPKASVREERG